MSARAVFDRNGVSVWKGDAREVAASQEAGSFSLAIVDGPYALGKAEWDSMATQDLPEWYAPHLEDLDRLCGPSASLYLWNEEEGWAVLHPHLLAMGWRFRCLITWDKTMARWAGAIDTHSLRSYPITTEVCGFYQRDDLGQSPGAGAEVAYAAGADPRNWVRIWMAEEWKAAGLTLRDANKAMGTATMAGHYFVPSQWSLPTWEAFQKLAQFAQWNGPPRDRPWMVHPSVWPDGGHRDTWEHLRDGFTRLLEEWDHLREEYEARRPVFNCPMGVSNVWTARMVQGPERLRHPDGSSLHPCQKPLEFSTRMILASSRPGERVWVPFGGTCREAVAAQVLRRRDPSQAREVVTAELDQDGRGYLDAVVPVLEREGEGVRVRVRPRPTRGVLRKGGGLR